MRRTFLAAVTVATALGGLTGPQTAAASPAAPRQTATAQDGREEHCSDIHKLSDAGNKAHVRVCAKVDQAGRLMNIATGSDCWHAFRVWDKCDVTGSWKMFRDGKQIANGTVNGWYPYVGPGTYKVVSKVTAHGHNTDIGSFSGTRLRDTLTDTFALTTPKEETAFAVAVAPKHRKQDGETPITFTVTSTGEAAGSLDIQGNSISSTTPGCTTWGGDAHTTVRCEIVKGEKQKIELTAHKPRRPSFQSLQNPEFDRCNIKWKMLKWNGSVGTPSNQDTIYC
ncbi:hypothetical protein ACQB60_45010, partial [Actinomycetota bacterium Odt1-20B]